MSEYAEMVARALAEAEFDGGIRPGDIAKIFGGGESINCYPGIPGGSCKDTAVFVSLSSSAHKGKHRGHLSCRQAIEKLVQHMQGSCLGITRHAVVVVDSWDAEAASEWMANLKRIQSETDFGVYLVAGGSISPVRF